MCDQNFGNPALSPNLKLDKGDAIIATIQDPFGASPTITLQTIQLKTGTVEDGVRAIEWISALDAYVIVGGPVPAGNVYSLWTWDGLGDPQSLALDGFDQLCRPEAVIQLTEDDTDFLVVLSEESGGACAGVEFTYIKAEILD